jgi:hypothetical protein
VTEGRGLAFEPFLVVFAGLVVARLVVPAADGVIIDFILAATLVAGGFGKPFASRRRWWLSVVGLLAVAVVAADAWVRQ